jgi:cytochrome c-type biogenesis protein CcmE
VNQKAFVVGVISLAGAALAWLSFGSIGENLVYYWSPKELLENRGKAVGATIRLGGQVAPGSIAWDPAKTDLAFAVTDGAATVRVEGRSIPPQMFRENIGVVVEGTLRADGVFTSERLMVKHSNEYKAPEGHSGSDVQALSKTLDDAP